MCDGAGDGFGLGEGAGLGLGAGAAPHIGVHIIADFGLVGSGVNDALDIRKQCGFHS